MAITNWNQSCQCVVLQGALFFDSLLQKLQATYQFRLDDYMDGVAVRARPLRKTVKSLCVSLNMDRFSFRVVVKQPVTFQSR